MSVSVSPQKENDLDNVVICLASFTIWRQKIKFKHY